MKQQLLHVLQCGLLRRSEQRHITGGAPAPCGSGCGWRCVKTGCVYGTQQDCKTNCRGGNCLLSLC